MCTCLISGEVHLDQFRAVHKQLRRDSSQDVIAAIQRTQLGQIGNLLREASNLIQVCLNFNHVKPVLPLWTMQPLVRVRSTRKHGENKAYVAHTELLEPSEHSDLRWQRFKLIRLHI